MRSLGLFLFLTIVLFTYPGWPQDVPDVPASVAMSHIVKANPPIYPDLAAMSHIQGKITVKVTISPEGKVTEARMIAGHPIFETSAVDTIKRWKYQPFVLNGTPISVRTLVYVLFSQGPQAGLEQKYLV